MQLLVLESYLLLLQVDILTRWGDLQSIHAFVRKSRVEDIEAKTLRSVQDLCHAIDLACVFYFKTVLCLQRSAAATLLLRRHGHTAQMVIGAQMLPFKSHSWVEIDDAVVTDKPYMREIFQVLDRF